MYDRAATGGPSEVLLGDADPHASDGVALEDDGGHTGGQGLEQVEALPLHHLTHDPVQHVVIHGIGELVADLGPVVGGLEFEVHLEALPRFLLVGASAVVPEHGQPFQPDDGQLVASERERPQASCQRPSC
ncbi:MAG: hypothetical protein RJA51_1765 [Actinomycetota bacterium]